jgi:membrane protein implicated in regulation of membrane protease activity
LRSWILVFLIAAAVALMAAYSVMAVRGYRRARRRRREAQLWADLVSRHQELGQELGKVWQATDSPAAGSPPNPGDRTAGQPRRNRGQLP